MSDKKKKDLTEWKISQKEHYNERHTNSEIEVTLTQESKYNRGWWALDRDKTICTLKEKMWMGAKILDVGCGTGVLYSLLAKEGYDVYGFDISEKEIKRAKTLYEEGGLRNCISIADAENLPFGNESFDVIFCHAVFHHIENVEKALTEFRRCLKKDGKLILIEPSKKNPLKWAFCKLKGPIPLLDIRSPYEREFYPKEIMNFLKKKFNKIEIEPYYFFFSAFLYLLPWSVKNDTFSGKIAFKLDNTIVKIPTINNYAYSNVLTCYNEICQ